MDSLKELVRNLAAIIILTSFLEMILPNTKMKGYTRLVLGLFVIIIILNPVLGFLGSKTEFSVQAWSSPSQDEELDNILENAKKMKAQSQESAVEEYVLRLEQQIAALVRLTPEINHAEVDVNLDPTDPLSSPGAIEKVVITAHLKDSKETVDNSKDGSAVADIGIAGSMQFEAEIKTPREQIERRIQSIVGDFFGLMPDQVSVKVTS